MSRSELRTPSGGSPKVDELEELGDDAIISQQTDAHLPQKRIVVSEEARSVVISDDAPPPNSLRRYRAVDRAEPTLVIRDRDSLEAFRRNLVEKRRKIQNERRAPYLWAGVAIAAFAVGGLLVLVFMGGESAAPVETGLGAHISAPKRAEQVAPEPAPAPAPETEARPRQVKLEELPVERP